MVVNRSLECFAFIAAATGQNERAAVLLGAAEALRESINSSMTLIEHREYDPFAAGLQEAMRKAALEAAWGQGRSLSMEAAIQFALDESSAG